ncbi:acetate--CoA ligase family protein [Desulfofustis limnaeus]|uniref:Acyl-CoA synthetase n=1 Tax=Desulfofustis limnaeus TaxID=2740163 RepID=A0ABM7WBE1_9BACT|nr:acetate--CoA ligase family protein [Desulfofustis limnaeus]BDD88196.1 acyl-CoA synthetase [Desulfofustis limnaeus]
MEKFFYPDSIAILGLSSRENNVSRLILANLIRWGYSGRIFGVNARGSERQVDGVRMYREIDQLPIVPDLAVALLPARFIPDTVRACGSFGIRRMAIPSGGFNETGAKGEQLTGELLRAAADFGVRFVGPNGLTIANTANGLCLPFTPLYRPPQGGMSVITQSGGLGLSLWNLIADEHLGLAKFASIGNKLDLDEVAFLNYFARDPETEIICLYMESLANGTALIEAATACDKPVVLYKANTTGAGSRAAMSHTAAIHNDDDILDAALERAGIIRIETLSEFISVTKAFRLPPMKGKRIMAMSPAGGFSVIMADLCTREGFTFADPGREFYEEVATYGNAGIIDVSNPLDMGDIYDPRAVVDIFHAVLHNEQVDGAVYVNQWPRMPVGDDIFSRMFHTDLSLETMGAIRSAGKPLAVCLFGPSKTITKIKNNLSIPIFDTPEEMIRALKVQQEYYARKNRSPEAPARPAGIDRERAADWIGSHQGVRGEEVLELLELYGIKTVRSRQADDVEGAIAAATDIGYPVAMKVVSPDALHKSDVGGVRLGLSSDAGVAAAFGEIRKNLADHQAQARFDGVRIAAMAGPGYDLFVGGSHDESFGPIVFFGYGGIYVEVFNDIERALCPATAAEITHKLERLKCNRILQGMRGKKAADSKAYADLVVRVSCLLADFPQIKELDLNPVRLLEDGSAVLALDGRARIEAGS